MSGTPVTPSLSFGLESSAETGDVLKNDDYEVYFGNIVTGDGANAAPSFMEGIMKEILVAVVVAVAAKYAWKELF